MFWNTLSNIWEEKNRFLTSEHHAIWENTDGSLLDITPTGGEKNICFLTDATA